MADGVAFSVIIPTYGRPQYLAEAVQSVLDQTVDDLECIVVDDASPDPVVAADDPRVRVIRRDTNGGPAAARNTGIEAARGRNVAFLDDDDLYTPDRLEAAAEGLARAPVAICLARHLDADDGRDRVLEGMVADEILDDTTPHCGVTAVARDALVPFEPEYRATEDVEWWLRLAHGAPVTTVARLGLLVRRHEGERHTTGADARIAGSLRLLSGHEDYFRHHRRARAFRWRRIGLLALQGGDHRQARAAFTRSLLVEPRLRTAVGLARAWGVPL